MTKKDFQLIADAMKDGEARHHEEVEQGNLVDWYDMMTLAMCDALAQTNPRFDRRRFFEACAAPERGEE